MNSIAILGAGTWGIALAKMLKNTNKEVTVWSALPDEIEKLKKTSRHPKLPNVSLPLGIEYTTDIKSAIENKDIIMFAVPSVFVRQTAKKCKPYIKDNQIDIITLTSYKRNIFARLFNPSIARKMIFHSDTPLLVING